MFWPILMLAQNMFAALFAINARVIAKRFPHAAIPLNLVLYGAIVVSGLAVSVTQGIHGISAAAFVHFLPVFMLAGFCFAVTNILTYAVLQYVDAAIGTLLTTLNIMSSVILSSLIISEGLTVRQSVGGIVLVFSLLFILVLKRSRSLQQRLWLGVFLSVIASLFYGVAMVSEKYLLNHVTLPTYLTFGWGLQFLGVLSVAIAAGRFTKADFTLLSKAKFWQLAAPAGLLRAAGGLAFVISLKLANNLSVISIFSGLKVLLAALLAAYILNERADLARKYQAALLAMGGIALMLWG